MKLSRKQFFQWGGIAAILGLGGKKTLQALALSEAAPSQRIANQTQVRYALVIDSSKCKEGCTSCSDACHVAHNVPNHEDKSNEVKWIWKEKPAALFPEIDFTVQGGINANRSLPALCNHCENPPCVRVCPTQATFKRREGGIVMMDYHRCIGCRFCMAACPYGSRSFNYRNPREGLAKINPEYPTRKAGVVEKCNFCEEELAKGGQPRCVKSCPENAMIFGDLNNPGSKLRKVLAANPSLRRQASLGTGPSVFYLNRNSDRGAL